jgi:hypothetical protein
MSKNKNPVRQYNILVARRQGTTFKQVSEPFRGTFAGALFKAQCLCETLNKKLLEKAKSYHIERDAYYQWFIAEIELMEAL